MAFQSAREERESKIDFMSGFEEMTKLNNIYSRIQQNLSTAENYFRGISKLNESLAVDIMKIYASQSEYEDNAKQMCSLFKSLQLGNCKAYEGLNSLGKFFGEWQKLIEPLKGIKSKYEKTLKQEEHYKSKLEQLRGKSQSIKSEGKQQAPKDCQKLDRNEKKLIQAQNIHIQSQREAQQSLLPIFHSRFNHIDAFFSGVLRKLLGCKVELFIIDQFIESMKILHESMAEKFSDILNPRKFFNESKSDMMRSIKHSRIQEAIDHNMECIQQSIEEKEKERQKKLTPPPLPPKEMTNSVRRNSLKITTSRNEIQEIQEQNQNCEQQVYGMEYITPSVREQVTNNHNNQAPTLQKQSYSQGYSAVKQPPPSSSQTQKKSSSYVNQLLEEQFGGEKPSSQPTSQYSPQANNYHHTRNSHHHMSVGSSSYPQQYENDTQISYSQKSNNQLQSNYQSEATQSSQYYNNDQWKSNNNQVPPPQLKKVTSNPFDDLFD